jgi:hypothetical protein
MKYVSDFNGKDMSFSTTWPRINPNPNLIPPTNKPGQTFTYDREGRDHHFPNNIIVGM